MIENDHQLKITEHWLEVFSNHVLDITDGDPKDVKAWSDLQAKAITSMADNLAEEITVYKEGRHKKEMKRARYILISTLILMISIAAINILTSQFLFSRIIALIVFIASSIFFVFANRYTK